MRESLADWVNGYDWDFWFTGTFLPERAITDTIRTKTAFNSFLGRIGKQYHLHDINYFLAVERFRFGEETHCHALISGMRQLTYKQIGEAWRSFYGRERVEMYQKERGASFYLTKYVTKDLYDWDLKISKNKLNFQNCKGVL